MEQPIPDIISVDFNKFTIFIDGKSNKFFSFVIRMHVKFWSNFIQRAYISLRKIWKMGVYRTANPEQKIQCIGEESLTWNSPIPDLISVFHISIIHVISTSFFSVFIRNEFLEKFAFELSIFKHSESMHARVPVHNHSWIENMSSWHR